MKVNLLSKICLAALVMTISGTAMVPAKISPVERNENFQRHREFSYPDKEEISKTKDRHIFPSPFLAHGISSGKMDFCETRISNLTGWTIKVYIEGYYRGTLGEYDDMTIYYERAGMKIYLRADFKDGTYRYWGPAALNCRSYQDVFGIKD